MSVYWPLSALCVFVCVFVCVISNQSTSKKLHYVSDLSKLDILLHKIHKFPRLDMCRSIISLSKVTHQMWHNHLPFSQRKSSGGGGQRQQGKGGWIKFEKRGVGNIGGSS